MNKNEIWPNFFIVGAARAGTTSLYVYLSQHSEIFMSKRKEPDYFSASTVTKNVFGRNPIRDQSQYLELFRNVKNEKVIGEASTSYLADPDAAELIYKIAPNAKIIIMLRDPVERIFSYYLLLRRKKMINTTFHQQLQIDLNENNNLESMRLDVGFYSKHIKKYQEAFGINQIKIIIFEDMIKNYNTVINEIQQFLQVNVKDDIVKETVFNAYSEIRGSLAKKILESSVISKVVNKIFSTKHKNLLIEKFLYKKLAKPKISKEDGIFLQKFYQKDVKNVENILGRKLPWKWFNESQR